MEIKIAETSQEIDNCYSVMLQLRPHLTRPEFVSRIQAQMQNGYILVFVKNHHQIVSLAGCRIGNNLAWGRFLYIDDLVSDANHRSQGWCKYIFRWLLDYAKSNHCQQIHLDSGIQRLEAHQFYLHEGMEMTGYHFFLQLSRSG